MHGHSYVVLRLGHRNAPLPAHNLGRVLIHDPADRDAVASQLLRYRDGDGDDWADIIDVLTIHPGHGDGWHGVLGEIEAPPKWQQDWQQGMSRVSGPALGPAQEARLTGFDPAIFALTGR